MDNQAINIRQNLINERKDLTDSQQDILRQAQTLADSIRQRQT